jgi:hypothetical protein
MSLTVRLIENNKCLFEANITHNLIPMAKKVGVYEACWRPYKIYDIEDDLEDSVEVKARDIIYFLVRGVVKLKRSPETFRKYDSPNGWGTYDNFLPWLESYLAACEKHPNAIIKVYR